ncbi:D-arginine dehydrogenase [Sphingomonas sp. PP-F2F-G114-C0414]|uniref:NAD(P)/FAD-dependent oxidoreductase n=1 Tax=Sphingomonas sp. PP-F2F-G114-C0414 TaxID=2135662 RepID=UPI000EF87FCB|nr:FAD-binding oxidoreductase [Sphingomonas sp. PP-F2F-G114-C0414]RMB28557.1 D-arginine dehydrogenase [Sphingomonas sp. PP-F2F-G114-C0414]
MAPVYDIAIVGAGMAGASLAAALGPHARVLVLEAEDAPGYHATGRSAAFWSETYGGPDIQPLTTASGPFLEAGGHLAPLGSIHIGRAEDEAAIDAFLAEFAGSDVALDRVDPAAFVPGLRTDWTLGVQEASCAYIDVAALHAESIATARRAGVDFVSDAAFSGATRVGGVWTVDTKAGAFRARVIVDAAGAWADAVAVRAGVRPLGLQAYRRTMVQLRTDPGAPEGLPHIADIAGRFYFKPEPGGRLWLSPHDETPTAPCDAAPEEIDIAIAVDRFERVVDWRVAAIERRWAGLRTFAPDRLPIYGFDPDTPAFFWCAGQGGFGIQTAPAAALLAASLLLGIAPDPSVAAIDPARYSPHRF